MPALVSVNDVKAILEVPGELTDGQITAFIADADIIVQESLVGKGLSDARLATIEKYIAAHLAIQLTERGGLTSSQQGDAKDTYTNLSALGNSGIFGLQLTRYGQQAIFFDTTGTLLAQSKATLPAQFRVIGRADCD